MSSPATTLETKILLIALIVQNIVHNYNNTDQVVIVTLGSDVAILCEYLLIRNLIEQNHTNIKFYFIDPWVKKKDTLELIKDNLIKDGYKEYFEENSKKIINLERFDWGYEYIEFAKKNKIDTSVCYMISAQNKFLKGDIVRDPQENLKTANSLLDDIDKKIVLNYINFKIGLKNGG